ncbi:MAG: RNA-binding protein [Bacteroidales bacterium]|nr:RNA-binding protein [Bacteroidales bacterium]
MNIFVGNLDYKVNENDLEGLFEEYGTVVSSKIITDKLSGRSKGFGFIVMEDDAEAKQAIKDLNGAMLKNRELVVNEARPREERNNRY